MAYLAFMYAFLYLVSFPRHSGPYWRGWWTGAGREPYLIKVPGWVALLCGRPLGKNLVGYEHMVSQLCAVSGLASLLLLLALEWAGLIDERAARGVSVLAFLVLIVFLMISLWIGENRLRRRRLRDQAHNLTPEDRRKLRKRRRN
jgi:hypothetical protein